MSEEERPSSQPDFWDTRYEQENALFGQSPNEFVAEESYRLASESEVVELGAGEARTLLWLAGAHGHRGTAVDFSEEALETARERARSAGLSLETERADLRRWEPARQWDAAIVTFVQLLPEERPTLYQLIRAAVRPGGWILAEWFRPDHLVGDFDRLGPSSTDRMVPVAEVREAFSEDEVHRCTPVDVHLEEGPLLRGRAGVVQLVAQRRNP